jgi:hypothetical protein
LQVLTDLLAQGSQECIKAVGHTSQIGCLVSHAETNPIRLMIDLAGRQCTISDIMLNQDDLLSLDGNSGAVHPGRLTQASERPDSTLTAVANWLRQMAS